MLQHEDVYSGYTFSLSVGGGCIFFCASITVLLYEVTYGKTFFFMNSRYQETVFGYFYVRAILINHTCQSMS